MTTAVSLRNVTKRLFKADFLNRKSGQEFVAMSFGGFGLNGNIEQSTVLDRISFRVEEAEIFGLAGASGSGKTTLIRLLATLLRPDEGEIMVFGSDVVRQPQKCQSWINRVSIEASFFKQISALENLVQGVCPYRAHKVETLQRAEEILMKLDLDEKEIGLPMEALRRDQLQKITVARALLSRPRLLLLDEPTRGLDGNSRHVVYDLIRELRDESGATVLFASRDFHEMKSSCDRIAVLEGGQLLDSHERQTLELSIPCNLKENSAYTR
jgi:ABC-2 type transport system ATP-binding protein